MAVFVLDKGKRPLMPCSEKRARQLLARGRARIHRMHPFAIRIVDRALEDSGLQPLALKIDPGSKGTGVAVVRVAEGDHHVLHLAEVAHRGAKIRDALTSRRSSRRRRRGNLRFRPARFSNRRRAEGALPPSLESRVGNVASWAKRYQNLTPVASVTVETVRFDMQLMEEPEISGILYQQGTLAGYEAREYLLQKWDRACAYCDAKGVALEIDHIEPRSNGGSDRISNLTLACTPCNQRKGNSSIGEFLAHDPKRLAKIEAQRKRPLRDAAAVNVTRWAVYERLKALGVSIMMTTGGRTKFNRMRLGVPKSHAIDAACAGPLDAVIGWEAPTLRITATGRGMRQRMLPDAYGFPRGHRPRTKTVKGFRTGDRIKAVVPVGKHAGTYEGRVAVRTRGTFVIATSGGMKRDVGWRRCALISRGDGYAYEAAASDRLAQKATRQSHFPPALKGGVTMENI